MKLAKYTIGLTALALVASACSASATPAPAASGAAASSDRAGISIEVVTHGQASDPFWSIFKTGVDHGGKDMGVKVNYSAPDTFDMVKMGQLIDAACAKNPSGLVISLPDATALGPSVKKCVDAGIPVISANSGSDTFASLGILTHVGQEESRARLPACACWLLAARTPSASTRRSATPPSTPAATASPKGSPAR
jgi:simple sugar transport system substrate-binding protein